MNFIACLLLCITLHTHAMDLNEFSTAERSLLTQNFPSLTQSMALNFEELPAAEQDLLRQNFSAFNEADISHDVTPEAVESLYKEIQSCVSKAVADRYHSLEQESERAIERTNLFIPREGTHNSWEPVAFHPHKNRIAYTNSIFHERKHQLCVYDLEKREVIKTYSFGPEETEVIRFSDDGPQLTLVSPNEPRRGHVWSDSAEEYVDRFVHDQPRIRTVSTLNLNELAATIHSAQHPKSAYAAISPAGEYIPSEDPLEASGKYRVEKHNIYNVQTGVELEGLPGGSYFTFSDDGSKCVLMTSRGTFSIYAVNNGVCTAQNNYNFDYIDSNRCISPDAKMSPQGNYVVEGFCPQFIRDLNTPDCHREEVNGKIIGFNKDEYYIAIDDMRGPKGRQEWGIAIDFIPAAYARYVQKRSQQVDLKKSAILAAGLAAACLKKPSFDYKKEEREQWYAIAQKMLPPDLKLCF